MLRTSLRSRRTLPGTDFVREFLSSNAQDFIEDRHGWPRFTIRVPTFLSSNAQDFIEDIPHWTSAFVAAEFLSSNAQDFIEELPFTNDEVSTTIPEQ